MIQMLHKKGIRSGTLYTLGLGSIAFSFVTWLLSKRFEAAGIDRADRWGLFVGEWAPTFIAMGVALRIEETHRELAGPEGYQTGREQPWEQETVGERTPAGMRH
ncbi:hypothetical protein GCM10010106_27430 [Thermopolyspora flexuosa]|jgi:hypothetical protein|uniref:Uncharacterized protein n=1 Tax=Thermopolyspora flexuosa TaxID=103836 RepID=A0A543IWB0_9ACTN|nr:hypothetical protein [Thermopolyspora flexuosa]TQM74841.1 hypothetical protein FHX40_1525 [Thermopolyspora flexuosa]GGM79366.1 hypothetical protein GCM10010106_27430 [Thermopolyspora flexuosa]